MKQIIKEEKTQKIVKRAKKGFKYYAMGVMLVGATVGTATGVYAESDPLTVVNNLSDFIFSLTRAIGLIICGYAIVQIGLSFTTHDPSQRANGIMFLAGGAIVTFAKEILNLITG
jgi:hypothetical protein